MITLIGASLVATRLGTSLDPLVVIYSVVAIGGLACAVPYFRSLS